MDKDNWTYHQRRTSEGWKRAIAPYWAGYRAARAKFAKCPIRNVCREASGFRARRLFPACGRCFNMEGAIRADIKDWASLQQYPRKAMEEYIEGSYKQQDEAIQAAAKVAKVVSGGDN